MNLHGIAKPAYRAFELLHALGAEILHMEGDHPTVDAWSVRDGHSMSVLISNFALPRHPIRDETVHIVLRNAPVPAKATVRRIDDGHANATALWEAMGRPDYLSATMVEQLHAASAMRAERQPVIWRDRGLAFNVTVPPLGVAAIMLEFASFA
jgi:xylan 1,4-beta-xylosidase